MKRIFSIILCLILLLGTAAAFAETDAGETIFSEDFQSYKDGDTYRDLSSGNWNISVQSGDSITIETDPVTNSRALKMHIGNMTNNVTSVNAVFPEIAEGKVNVSFDLRAENHSKYLSGIGSLMYDTFNKYGFLSMFTFQNDIYATGDWKTVGKLSNYKNKYAHFDLMVNVTGKKCDIYIDGALAQKDVAAARVNMNYLSFNIRNGVNEFANYNGTDSGDGIYWIDNIKIEKQGLKVVSTAPAGGGENFAISAPASVTFNVPVNFNTASPDTIYLYENESRVPSGDYMVFKAASENVVYIKPKNDFEYVKFYTVVVTEGVKAQDNSLFPLSDNYSFRFKTESLIENALNIVDGGRYTGSITPEILPASGVIYNMTLVYPDGIEKEYTAGTTVSAVGSYTLKINAKNNNNGKEEEKQYKFDVIGAIAPAVKNVKITGEAKTGSILTGSYDFIDENNDTEGTSTFTWLISDEKCGEYNPIEGADNKEYVLTTSDENKYLKLEVTPVSQKEPYIGEAVTSEAFTGAFAPAASNINISGTLNIGKTLTAQYSYYDENGDNEEGSVFSWYKSEDLNGGFVKISGADKLTYVLSENDVNVYLMFGVIPKNSGLPCEGIEYRSEPVTGMFAPQAKNVKIEGKAKIGQILGGFYDFVDLNNDHEAKSIYKWYAGTEVVSDSPSLKITEDLEGETVYFEVTPVSENYPYKGETLKSSAVNIPNNKPSHSGGGGGVSSYSKNTAEIPVTDVPAANQEENFNNFLDIKNHWAKDEIINLYKKKIVTGVSESEFLPDQNITRAEIAAIIAKAFQFEKGDEQTFSDISKSDWFYDYITALKSASVICGDGVAFRPNDFITREELCVIISNTAKLKGLKPDTHFEAVYEDENEISDWAADSIRIAAELKLVNGITKTKFAPHENATRAQTVVIVDRLLNVLGGNVQ